MQGKLMFALGAAAGYVFGTRTGRKGYERLKSQAGNLWLNPHVQETVSTVGEFAKDKIPVVGGTIADASQKLTDRVRSVPGAHSTSSDRAAESESTTPSATSSPEDSGMASATSGSPSFSDTRPPSER